MRSREVLNSIPRSPKPVNPDSHTLKGRRFHLAVPPQLHRQRLHFPNRCKRPEGAEAAKPEIPKPFNASSLSVPPHFAQAPAPRRSPENPGPAF